MAAADSTGGGTWRPVQLCGGNPALLCDCRALSGKFLRGTRRPASSRRRSPCGRRAPSAATRRAVSKPLASTDAIVLAPVDPDYLAHFKEPRACAAADVFAQRVQ